MKHTRYRFAVRDREKLLLLGVARLAGLDRA